MAPSDPPEETSDAASAPPHHPSRLGHFIQTYSGFLSSFVIGVAGLVATSIWQYRQSQTAERQAASEQAIARTKAENDWRIARADILAKNLNVLASQAPETADQRFGVLLSLARGNILDPELAVSYALELGKVNPDYMRSVLASTAEKNYVQLEHAFALTCLQRFGVERAAEICKDDKLSERSDAIAELISDELGAANATGNAAHGPLSILHEEREVQARPAQLMWLFEPYLQDLYEHRQWHEIEAFESSSVGSRLVAALVLATARTGELVTNVEQTDLEKFHADRRKWLVTYMFGQTCDPECRGKIVDVMLSTYGEAQGDYDEALRRLVQAPRAESGPAIQRLHARLLWCQVDGDDLEEFRDHVLVPALRAAIARPDADRAMLEDLVSLLAMVPEPAAAPAAPAAQGTPPAGAAPASSSGSAAAPTATLSPAAAWRALQVAIDHAGDHLAHAYTARRATVRHERTSPPPMIKKVDFCSAAAQARAHGAAAERP